MEDFVGAWSFLKNSEAICRGKLDLLQPLVELYEYLELQRQVLKPSFGSSLQDQLMLWAKRYVG
jgi:hypothetical protein